MNQKPVLDLIFPDTHNIKTLAIVDVSYIPDNFYVQNATLEITPPNFDKIMIPFQMGALNLVNSNLLKLTCDDLSDLPDGLWCVRASITPAYEYYVQKDFLRVDQLKRKLEEMFLCIDLSCGEYKDMDIKLVDEAWILLQGAISAANRCNTELALRLYKMASKVINNYLKQVN